MFDGGNDGDTQSTLGQVETLSDETVLSLQLSG